MYKLKPIKSKAHSVSGT